MEVNATKVYTWANQAGLDFFGEDVIGAEAARYFEGDQGTYEAVPQCLFRGDENVIYVESWQRRKDGEKRLLAWWCLTLKGPDGRLTGALSSARDITEQRMAEQSRRESEARYQNLIDNAPLAILVRTRKTGSFWPTRPASSCSGRPCRPDSGQIALRPFWSGLP